MSTATPSPLKPRPQLAGQTVVVIGGSAGIGLETARLARAEGAKLVLAARNPERLQHVASELAALGAVAFDATDFERLAQFFGELPTPIDHVLVTGPGPYYAPLAEFDFEKARRVLEAHLFLPLQVARHAANKVRPGGTLLFMGGTGGRRTAKGFALISAITAAMAAMTKNLALELALFASTSSPPGLSTRHCRVAPRQSARRAPRAAAYHSADRPRGWPSRRGRARRTHHDEHRSYRRHLRHRRRATARRGLAKRDRLARL